MKSIDLGQTYGDMCCPSPMKMDSKEETKHFPSFTYDGEEELGLPKEGIMEVSFRVVRETRSENSDGKKNYSCTVELRSIIDFEGEEEMEAPAKSDMTVSDALDALMKEKMKSSKKKESY